MHGHFIDILSNTYFWAGFGSWVVAQGIKMICGFYKTRRLDFRYMVSTGGMPSAHSATVSGIATSVGLGQGFDSAAFAVAMCLALIVMFDASTVRRAAGQQAKLLNEMVDELLREHRLSEIKLKELLGHTRLEVVMGAITGALVALKVVADSN